jgi:hypothetical protein
MDVLNGLAIGKSRLWRNAGATKEGVAMNCHSPQEVLRRAVALACVLLLASVVPMAGLGSTDTQPVVATPEASAPLVKLFSVPGLEEPLVATGATTAAEDAALLALLDQYQRQPPTPEVPATSPPLSAFCRTIPNPPGAWPCSPTWV